MDKIVGQVYETTNYDMFVRLEGNRGVKPQIVNKIIRSVQKVGQVNVPITINEKQQIIDGQNRLQAFKKLNLPVYYTISNGAGIQQCISLNINQSPWKMIDYIESYAELGNESYIILLDMIKKYSDFNAEFIVSAILDRVSGCKPCVTRKTKGVEYNHNLITDGAFECTQEMANEASTYIEQLRAFKDVIKKLNGAQRYMNNAILFAIRHADVNPQFLLDRMNLRYAKMPPFTSTQTAIESLESAHNFNNKKHVVYLTAEYDKAMRASNPAYKTRWSKFE